MPITNLLLDLDGTLLGARNFPVFVKFSTHMLRRFYERSGSLVGALQAYSGVQRAVLAEDGERKLTNAARATLEFARALNLPPAEADGVLHSLVDEIFPQLKPHFFPIPGAREFVEWARPRYPMILATNPVWKEPIIRMRLEWAGIDPAHFRFITHSERMYAAKPSLIYYEDILRQGGLDPRTTLLVGDDPRNDLPAVRAGISVFLLAPTGAGNPQAIPSSEMPTSAAAPAFRGNWEALRTLLTPGE